MRWTGAAVAEAYRILVRGGVYLYTGKTAIPDNVGLDSFFALKSASACLRPTDL